MGKLVCKRWVPFSTRPYGRSVNTVVSLLNAGSGMGSMAGRGVGTGAAPRVPGIRPAPRPTACGSVGRVDYQWRINHACGARWHPSPVANCASTAKFTLRLMGAAMSRIASAPDDVARGNNGVSKGLIQLGRNRSVIASMVSSRPPPASWAWGNAVISSREGWLPTIAMPLGGFGRGAEAARCRITGKLAGSQRSCS